MNFLDYLRGKKIDAQAFQQSDPDMFETWRVEFEQMHPNSFTVQKLNLINPIRRKYILKEPAASSPEAAQPELPGTPAKPGKPVIKPKPKFS